MQRSLVAWGTAAVMALALAAPAGADAEGSEYAEWTLSGRSGDVSIAATGFPNGNFTTDSTRTQVPSGQNTWLGTGTPFGETFGSSKGKPYLLFGAAGIRPSTTTVTFDAPTPAGRWGFALGDIDSDKVIVEATGPGGTALTADELGWQGAFNYCAPTPRPASCTRRVYTDVPTWDPATSTMIGNVVDTDGASGWFIPKVPITSLKLTFSVQVGIPNAQLWMAAQWTENEAPIDPVDPPPVGKADISLTKTASPKTAVPGQKITFTVKVTNSGSADEPNAEFSDDLGDVIDDATYNNDAKADGGQVAYQAPMLDWRGPVDAGETRTITYSVRVQDPVRGDGKIRNAVIGSGPRMTCQEGGAGCGVSSVIKKPAKKPHKKPKHKKKHRCRIAVVSVTDQRC